jgi:hypothetical protein
MTINMLLGKLIKSSLIPGLRTSSKYLLSKDNVSILYKDLLRPSRARDARACRWQASGMMDSHLLVVSGVK